VSDDELHDRLDRRAEIFFGETLEYDERPETVHKVWGYTYWYGRGPVYTYNGSKLPARISRAWLLSVHPPYYDGIGIAIRLWKTTIRFGICYPKGEVLKDPYDETFAEIARGMGAVPVGTIENEDRETEVEEVELTNDQKIRLEAERRLWAQRLAQVQQERRFR
jgi:hypothetical protein